MAAVDDSNNIIGGLEKINTLWKQYNNLINTKPDGYSANEEIPFNSYTNNNDIFNENVPQQILVTNDTILNIKLPNNNTIEFTLTPNDCSLNNYYLNIDILDSLFDNCNNILIGSKCNFENFGYKHIEFYYKKECYPTIYNTKDQLYTWFIPDTSYGNISNIETKNLLKNTIANLYDPYYNTYKYKLFYQLNSNFYTINFASNPYFAYLDYQSGFLYFYGGIREKNKVTLPNIRSQSDPTGSSPPYISYMNYNGNFGFNNLNLKGDTIIDGSLSIVSDLSFSDISNLNYNILNTKQIKQFVQNLNASTNDASFGNIFVDGKITVNGDISANSYIGDGSQLKNLTTIFSNKTVFDFSSITTDTDELQDLSNTFFNTITPTKNNTKILININVDLYCSYALEERITIELWKNTDILPLFKNSNLGSIIATGGLTIPYNITYLDENNDGMNENRYYIKFKLENNNSKQQMGIINLQTSNYNIKGSSNIILREL